VSDNYDSWVERVVGGRDGKPLEGGEIVKSSAGEPFGAIDFVRIQKDDFLAEVGKKGDDYIFHFFPAEKYLNSLFEFSSRMEDALLESFKDATRVQAAWEDLMKAYAVKASGFANNVWGDELALRVVSALEQKLKTPAV
jgi:hypothetical protein